MVERLPYKQDVPGSNPGSPMNSIFVFILLKTKIYQFCFTPTAEAQLACQAALFGGAGSMRIDLLEDSFGEGLFHVKLSEGSKDGIPITCADGITLFASQDQ